MFLLNSYILKKIVPSVVLVLSLFMSFSLVESSSKPEDIMLLLGAADVELIDPLTYFDGLKDAYIVSGQKIVYEKELLRTRFLVTLKKVMAGLHTALLPDYSIIVHGIIAQSLVFWPNGLEKVQLFKWFEQANAKIQTDGIGNKKGKIKEIFAKQTESTSEEYSKVNATQSSNMFDVVSLIDEKKATEQNSLDKKSKKRPKITKGTKAKKARVENKKTVKNKKNKVSSEKTSTVPVVEVTGQSNDVASINVENPINAQSSDQLSDQTTESLLSISSNDVLENKQAPQEEVIAAPQADAQPVAKKRVYRARKVKNEVAAVTTQD